MASWYKYAWLPYAVTQLVGKGVNYALRSAPSVTNATPSEIADFDVPTAEEGRPVPVIFGTVRVTGSNVLWYGDLYNQPIIKKVG